MKIVIKNNSAFATGMLWQIAEEGKKTIDVAKLVKDTKHDMYCYIDNIKPTWGFCKRSDLASYTKVASLGKFIVTCSKLSDTYGNSIICYKFNSFSEEDIGITNDTSHTKRASTNITDTAIQSLGKDLYGYVVLLNGTICPDEGEYVADFAIIKHAILTIAKKYAIETLYLPCDVAQCFFGAFERLKDSIHNQQQTIATWQHLTTQEHTELTLFMHKHRLTNSYQILTTPLCDTSSNHGKQNNSSSNDDDNSVCGGDNYKNNSAHSNTPEFSHLHTHIFTALQSLVNEASFIQHWQATKEKELKYLIPNIYFVQQTSSQIYWQNNKFKAHFNKSLIHSVKYYQWYKYRLLLLVTACCLFFLTGHKLIELYNDNIAHKIAIKSINPITTNNTSYLQAKPFVSQCLFSSDKYFASNTNLRLIALECSPLKATYHFSLLNHYTTQANIYNFLGNSQNIIFNNNSIIYTRSLRMSQNSSLSQAAAIISPQAPANSIKNTQKIGQTRPLQDKLNQLKQYADYYQIKLTVNTVNTNTPSDNHSTRYGLESNNRPLFSMETKLSPIFLAQHGMLDNTLLNHVSMQLDSNSGFYNWVIHGAIK